ncbi:SHOCT domain-containing protein [Nocardiopsis sp. NPDC050513]|uniref:SHOCT domain-containing protein n=1 Tax=Nocardiopsis sp. NPDC050513 TaxID=3364338 RepID=UPI00378BD77F
MDTTITATAPHWADGPPPFAPLGALMLCLLTALAVGALLFTLARRRGHRPPWAAHRPEGPEQQARRTLADRFARGDITVEEFLERASALNWTPGADSGPGARP